MAQTQKTIRFNKLSDEIIRAICPNDEVNYNFAVNQLILRYKVMCLELMKGHFSEDEISALAKAYEGYNFNSDIELEAKAFNYNVSKSSLHDDISNQKTEAFLEKCGAMSTPQIIATFHAIHCFLTPPEAESNGNNKEVSK